MLIGLLLVGCGVLTRTPALANAPAPAEVPAVVQERASAPPGTLFVVRRGWHIDIGFAVDDLGEPLSAMVAGFPQARYLLFGFGDRRYLTATRHGAPSLLRALWPGPGLLLATGLRATPDAAFSRAQVIPLPTSREGMLRSQTFIWDTLTNELQLALKASRNGGGAVTGLPGPYEGSSFFDSRSTYSAVHTCNTWAAEVLKKSGFVVRSRGTLFAGQLWHQVKKTAQSNSRKPTPGTAAATIPRRTRPTA